VADGYFSLVLHAHLPFVRHPERPDFLEEDWLFEAITEVYLPLISVLRQLQAEQLSPRLALSVSPTLCEMLADPLLQTRYERHLDNLLALADKEVARTRQSAPQFLPAAQMYDATLRAARHLWRDTLRRDLLGGFRELQEAGALELITCCATHGFLPLISTEEAQRAQITVAVASHEMHFGRAPRGIWFPECGYAPGLDKLLARANLEYFIADTHAVLFGEPRPRYGVHAPVRTPDGVAVFARDLETSRQVWSAESGYPGDPFYREFHRDLGWDAPHEYLLPHLHTDGARRHLGLKYHRVTGRDVPLHDKQPYDPLAALARVAEHARHFVGERVTQARRLREHFKGRRPHIVAPYDAELFGHWWLEGPRFLDLVFRELQWRNSEIKAITPGDFLDLGLPVQSQQPAQSSWGAGGYFEVWLNERTSWMCPPQHAAEARMTTLADAFRDQPGETTRRALNQAARELLLAQSSDWAFQISRDTATAYAASRFRAHIARFHKLANQITDGRIETESLAEMEQRDNLFAELDYRIYCSR
jgi:1,4-alpha-glucan branching enzyme